jgi:CheY-like chemotaxis protein
MNQNLRILVVDDDRRMTRTLADILSLSGHQVEEAWSGAEALAKARELPFDCVLTDIKMPEMDGVEMHRQLREAQPGLPVVLMTAYASDELIHRGLDDGVVGVLEKPLDISLLLQFLASMVKHHVIVVVDDDPVFCHTLDDILRMRGFWVTGITDPHADVEQIAGQAQVILLDMKLNSVSGADILRSIREKYADLPVILVTGYREEMASAIQGALEIKAYTCLYKPLEVPQLLHLLADFQLNRLRKLLKAN